jgi:hypothetical protein
MNSFKVLFCAKIAKLVSAERVHKNDRIIQRGFAIDDIYIILLRGELVRLSMIFPGEEYKQYNNGRIH